MEGMHSNNCVMKPVIIQVSGPMWQKLKQYVDVQF
jgi:hypothetical protein